MLQIISSSKGTEKLLNDGRCYTKDRTNVSGITWRCFQRDCKGRCKTNVTKSEIIKEPSEHSCGRTFTLDEIKCKEKLMSKQNLLSNFIDMRRF